MIVLEDNNLKGFECTGTLIWLYRIISLIELKCRAFSVVPASLRLNYVEGSLSNQRALAQLVESMERSSKSPNALPSIPNRASVNPQSRFRQSPIAFHQKHCFVPMFKNPYWKGSPLHGDFWTFNPNPMGVRGCCDECMAVFSFVFLSFVNEKDYLCAHTVKNTSKIQAIRLHFLCYFRIFTQTRF